MDFFEFLIALVSVVGAFVTIWIILVYQRKERKLKSQPDTEFNLRDLSAMAQSMNERIDTLESILDAEVPGWRDQNEHQR